MRLSPNVGKFTIRKKERERLTDILLHEHASVDNAVQEVWKASLEEFLERSLFVVVVIDRGVGVIVHGPFPTRAAANKAIQKGEVFAASPGSNGLVIELLSHEYDDIDSEGEGLW